MSIPVTWLTAFRKYISSFVTITDEQWQAFEAHLFQVTVPKGKNLVSVDDTMITIGFIIHGLLRTYFTTEQGKEYTTDFCKENQLTANYDIITNNNNSGYTTEALEDTVVLLMDYNDFQVLCKKYDAWGKFKTSQIEHYYSDKLTREKDLLALSAHQKYLQFNEKYQDILHRIQQYHIASYLGITPVALSRIKKTDKKT